MFNRRLIPYIIAIGIVALLLVCYIGFKAYQRHLEFDRFISDAQAFSGSLNSRHDSSHPADGHTHGEEKHSHSYFSEAGMVLPSLSATVHHQQSVGNMPLAAQLSGGEILEMFDEWIETGKKSDLMKAYIKESQANNPFRGKVIQRVVSPHGQIHTVLAPEGYEYQEGDAILKSELDPPTEVFSFGGEPMHLIVAGVRYDVPEEYYSIEDPHEREVYFNKFTWSIENDISMAEVEKKVEAGELDFSLSEAAKRSVDESKEKLERAQWLSNQFAKPLPPDRPPVKVTFLLEEGEDAPPGWLRKLERNPRTGSGPQTNAAEYTEKNTVSEEGSSPDTNTTLVRPSDPVSPSDLSTPFESKSTSQSEVMPSAAQTPNPPTVESLETQLREQLSSERFSKARQLIEQYGAEEGLRRLRETDPDTARQFDRQRNTPPTRSEPATR